MYVSYLLEAFGKAERAQSLGLASFDRAHVAAHHCVRGAAERVLRGGGVKATIDTIRRSVSQRARHTTKRARERDNRYVVGCGVCVCVFGTFGGLAS